MALLRIGVIGTGKWGQNHVKTLAALASKGECELVGLYDANPEQAKKIADAHQTKPRSLRWLLNKTNCDAVTIATPSATHAPLAIKAMKKGLDVLVEKPSGMNFSQASKLAHTADALNRTLVVGHEFRFHPGIVKIKQLLDEGSNGTLGTPHALLAHRAVFNAPRADMGVLYALAIHDVDLFGFLLNQPQPKRVFASVTSHWQPDAQVEEHATITLDFDKGVSAVAIESWDSPHAGKTRELTLVASKGAVKVDFLTLDSIQFFPASMTKDAASGKWTANTGSGAQTITFERKEPLEEELRHFISLATGKTPRAQNQANGTVGASAVRVIDACLKSARTGKSINLNP